MAMCTFLLRKPFTVSGIRSLWTSRVLLTDQSKNVNDQEANNQKTNHHHTAKEETDEEYEKKIKTKVLQASLKFVHDLGWRQQTISAGAESIGYPGIAHGMFPKGGAELVQHFYLICNSELNKILKERELAVQKNPELKEKLEKQVHDALKIRLEMVIPYKKTWPQALALMSLPPNVPTALANLLTLVDDICYYTGDRSVDINWYTRRIVLAGIYKTTELYMLQDNSEDHKQTWNFLERRIQDAIQIHSHFPAIFDTSSRDQTLSRVTETAAATFVTARNILGLNWNR